MIFTEQNFPLPLGGSYSIESTKAIEYLTEYYNNVMMLSAGMSAKDLFGKNKFSEVVKFASKTSEVEGWELMYDKKYDWYNIPDNSVLVMPLSGVMQMSKACGAGVNEIITAIQNVENNKKVIGTVLQVDSGGGDSYAGEQLFYEIQNTTKPVVCHNRFSGSAAILGTLAADQIIAANTGCKFGSIGTYATIDNKLIEKINKHYSFVYANKSTRKNEEMNEVLKGNFDLIQQSVDKTNDKFIQKCIDFRGIPDKNGALEGAMFDADEAKKLNFFDSYGNLSYAIGRVEYYAKNGRKKRM